jgi:hypothetical protein
MHGGERKVPENKPQSIPEPLLKLLHDGMGLTAIGAFIVAVFNEGNRSGR